MFSKEDLIKAKGATLHFCGDLVSRYGKGYRVYVIEDEDGALEPKIEDEEGNLVAKIEERKPKGL